MRVKGTRECDGKKPLLTQQSVPLFWLEPKWKMERYAQLILERLFSSADHTPGVVAVSTRWTTWHTQISVYSLWGY